jgi:hypothetical protein
LKLVPEFVEAKKSRLNALTRFYLYLNHNYTELILLKNEEDQLEKIVQAHSKGEVSVPTELE